MGFAPLITRLYGPEVFGLQGVFISVVGLLAVVAALGYPIAIVLPKHDEDAIGLVRLCLLVGGITATIATVSLYFFGAHILELLNAEAITSFMYLIPLGMLAGVLSDVLAQWLIRKKAYRHTAKYGVVTTLLVNSVKAGMGFVNPTALALILTNTIGGLFGTTLTYQAWRRRAERSTDDSPRAQPRAELAELARRYRDFPLLRTPQNLINVFSRHLPMLLLAAYFGAGAAGQYAIAMAVLAIPVTLIGSSVVAVFYPRINEAILNGENARQLIIKATAGMAVTGALPFLVVIVAGPPLFTFVFGAEWHMAGVYAQWLSIWLFVGFMNRPSVSAIPALRLQGVLLAHEIVSVILRVAALYIGFSVMDDAVSAVAMFSFVGMLLNAWLIFYVIHASRMAEVVR